MEIKRNDKKVVTGTMRMNEERTSDNYPIFSKLLKENFTKNTADGKPLFRTKCKDLFTTFLENIPEEGRQHYNCSRCRSLVNRHGGLVKIDETTYEITSALWDETDVPEFFKEAILAMKNRVLKLSITSAFYSDLADLGTATTGEWNHMAVKLPVNMVNMSVTKNAGQLMNDTIQNFALMKKTLKLFNLEVIKEALRLLKAENLLGWEKCIGPVQWLFDLHTKYFSTKNEKMQDNILWMAVATAPTGFCKLKNGMSGRLMNCIIEGSSFNHIKRLFDKEMDGINYQRPKAAPKYGAVRSTEDIVRKLGIDPSLDREFAVKEDIQKLWESKDKIDESTESGEPKGRFDHLKKDTNKPKEVQKLNIPCVTMTWKKFEETILPDVKTMELYIPNMHGRNNYSAIVTAKNIDAPPIIMWDRPEQRNPFSYYSYHEGSTGDMWGLEAGYCKVNAICETPSMWYGGDYQNQLKAVMLILDGARDSRYKDGNAKHNGLFPSILISELYEHRKTIEAFAASATISGYEKSTACGLLLPYGSVWNERIRVTTDLGTTDYLLERWD